MRMSDWSSDVCSSDLAAFQDRGHAQLAGHHRNAGFLALEHERGRARGDLELRQLGEQVEDFLGDAVAEVFVLRVAAHVDEWQDRESVVWGKSGSVRVDLGGRRIIKKKK